MTKNKWDNAFLDKFQMEFDRQKKRPYRLEQFKICPMKDLNFDEYGCELIRGLIALGKKRKHFAFKRKDSRVIDEKYVKFITKEVLKQAGWAFSLT